MKHKTIFQVVNQNRRSNLIKTLIPTVATAGQTKVYKLKKCFRNKRSIRINKRKLCLGFPIHIYYMPQNDKQ